MKGCMRTLCKDAVGLYGINGAVGLYVMAQSDFMQGCSRTVCKDAFGLYVLVQSDFM